MRADALPVPSRAATVGGPRRVEAAANVRRTDLPSQKLESAASSELSPDEAPLDMSARVQAARRQDAMRMAELAARVALLGDSAEDDGASPLSELATNPEAMLSNVRRGSR